LIFNSKKKYKKVNDFKKAMDLRNKSLSSTPSKAQLNGTTKGRTILVPTMETAQLPPTTLSNAETQLEKENGTSQKGNESHENQDPSSNAQTLRYIKKALTTSTLHRLGSVFENDSLPLKIILGFVFLACTAICLYYIIITIIAFAEYSVLTVGSIVYEVPAEFPGK
jgi:hypothetical protein